MRTMEGKGFLVPNVSDSFHDVYFTEQTFGQPIQGCYMTLTSRYQQMLSISGVLCLVWPKLGQFKVKVLWK